jgi:hypothetical protein
MLRMIGTSTGAAPVLVCDECGRRIESYREGIAASAIPAEGEYAAAYHYHRGACHNAAEARSKGRGGWADLSDHVVQLVHNVAMPRPPGILTLEERVAELTGGYTF